MSEVDVSSHVTLGEVVEVTKGLSYQGKFLTEDGLPLVNLKCIERGGGFRPEGLKPYSGPHKARHVVEAGDLVLANTDLTQDGGIIGCPAIVPALDHEDGHGLISHHLCRARVRDETVSDRSFLYYVLRGPWFRAYAQGVASGTTVLGFRTDDIESFAFELPPLKFQRRASAALGAFDDLIENNRRRIEILEEMARLIYRDWFVHFRFPGHEGVEFVDSELGAIPGTWDAVALSELVSTQYGYTESTQIDPVGPHYLRGMDMNKTSYIDWSTVPFCPISDKDREKFKVDVGDVFVIRMADPGKISICEREVNAVFASYLVRMRPTTDRLMPYYLFFTLSDERYQGWVTGASTGATRKSVSAKVMTEPQIAVPPRHVQQEFVNTVGPIRQLLTNLLDQNAVLTQARDLLLPRLISGELDVSDLELDLSSVA